MWIVRSVHQHIPPEVAHKLDYIGSFSGIAMKAGFPGLLKWNITSMGYLVNQRTKLPYNFDMVHNKLKFLLYGKNNILLWVDRESPPSYILPNISMEVLYGKT